MPHVIIKHYPNDLTAEQRDKLAAAIEVAICETFSARPEQVSVALLSVTPEDWRETVIEPDIKNAGHLLVKKPGYPI